MVLPLPYAERQLAKGLYVELWYFTNAGLAHAAKESRSVDDEAMTMIRGPDDILPWVLTSAAKGAGAVNPDHFLTWEDFCQFMLTAVRRADWPQDRVVMFTKFWSSL